MVLALPLMVGGVIGAQFGVGFGERLKAEQLRACWRCWCWPWRCAWRWAGRAAVGPLRHRGARREMTDARPCVGIGSLRAKTCYPRGR